MSETITLTTGQTAEIHGTFDAAEEYLGIMYGDTYDTWNALSDDNKKKTLAAAVRYLNAQQWSDDADTFAERDAITEFATAQYELAVLIADDPALTQSLTSGSNIQSLNAGSAGLTFFAPTSLEQGTATKLPPIVDRLVGAYLAATSVSSLIGGYGNEGDCDSPYSDCEDYDRGEPY